MEVARQKQEPSKRLVSHYYKVAHREYQKAKTTGCHHHYQKALIAYKKATRIALGGFEQS